MSVSKHQRILNQIAAIRDSHPQMSNIFIFGSCFNLFCILHSIYPEARAYFNLNHVITEIDGRFYDISGSVSSKGYSPLTAMFGKQSVTRSFRQMHSGNKFRLRPGS